MSTFYRFYNVSKINDCNPTRFDFLFLLLTILLLWTSLRMYAMQKPLLLFDFLVFSFWKRVLALSIIDSSHVGDNDLMSIACKLICKFHHIGGF